MYRLFSVHYGTAPSVQFEAGTGIASADLPSWLGQRFRASDRVVNRVAAEITRASAGEAAPELYVWPIDRRYRRDPASWLADASAYRVAPGAVLLSVTPPHAPTHRFGYAETLLALGCSRTSVPADLAFHHLRKNAMDADLEPLHKRYGIAASDVSGPSDAEFTVEMPAESLAAWTEAPQERTNVFYETFLHVSRRIQTMLRTWFRYEWPADLTRFDDLVASRATLMYILSAPHPGRSRTEFSYDVLSLESVKRLCRVGANRYAAELDRVAASLIVVGRTAAAHCYRSFHTREIMTAVRKERRTVARFIAVEAGIVDTLINFSVRVRSQQRVRDVTDAAADAVYTLRSWLRRLPLAGCEHDLATYVLIEATAALRTSLGLPATLKATLRLTPAENKVAA